MKRCLSVLGVLLAVPGCTPATMAGFDSVESGGGERLTINVPSWKSGKFRVNEVAGHVSRDDRRDAIGYGNDRGTGAYDAVEYGYAARFGRMAFAIDWADVGGKVEGRCGYSREEARRPIGALGTASPLTPLTLRCEYRIAGKDAGELELSVPEDPRAALVNARAGWIDLAGRQVQLHSQHRIAGIGIASDEATGYLMIDVNGRDVGALELTGGATRRAIVQRGAERVPATIAAITLALFWDPGDVG